MAKKSDEPEYRSSPSSDSVAEQRVPYVSGAILEKASKARRSPTTAEPMPAGAWPPVDDYLDEPDEAHRWERVGDERRQASPASPGHGDPHFELDALLKAHLARGYVGSVDLKTRVSRRHEYASDTCVRKAGIDPATQRRYLEELVFEVVHKRSRQETEERARGFAARGVRRQIGIFVREKVVREWRKSTDGWGEPLDLGSSLEDPCLAVPLPLAALFDPALAEEAIARALTAKGDPTLLRVRNESETRGRAEALLTVLGARGFTVSEERRRRIRAATDQETLDLWLRRAASATSLDAVLDEPG